MAIFFSSKNIPALQPYSLAERRAILAIAADKLITPEKLVLNIIKLLILIPPFIMMARMDSWLFILPLGFVLVAYFAVMKPIGLNFQLKYLDKAIKQFEAHQAD